MRKGIVRLAMILWATILVLALAGCAVVKTVQKNEAADKEQLLAAAGFKVKLADTPQKMTHLQALPQRKMFTKERQGKVYYLYADPLNCKCLYVGDQAAYQRFQQMQEERQIVAQERMAAEMNYEAQFDWGMYGPWDPWW
ncbi:MAG: hypothetical protein ACOZF2_01600 [Thermodesulfobacteriota bacterium]